MSVKKVKEQISQIAYSLEKGIIDELKAERLLLDLFMVSGSLLSDDNLEKVISVTAEINKEEDYVWGYDTALGTPKEILKEVKDILMGNDQREFS